MTADPQVELDALRRLLQEALSQKPDTEISAGALYLRRKFSTAAMERMDTEPDCETEKEE